MKFKFKTKVFFIFVTFVKVFKQALEISSTEGFLYRYKRLLVIIKKCFKIM